MESIASKGIDVSWYQGKAVPWAKLVEAGISWAYVRASIGVSADVNVEANVRGAAAAGMQVGVYHFLRSGDDVEKQISALRRATASFQELLTLPVAIDAEEQSAYKNLDGYVARIVDFEMTVARAGLGYPVLYTYESMLASMRAMGLQPILNMPVWVAKYPKPALMAQQVPKCPGWDVFAWQYDGDGGERMPNEVDCDYNFSSLTAQEIAMLTNGFRSRGQ